MKTHLKIVIFPVTLRWERIGVYQIVIAVFLISAIDYKRNFHIRRAFSNAILICPAASCPDLTLVPDPSCSAMTCSMQCRLKQCSGFNFRNQPNGTASCMCELIITRYLLWIQYGRQAENGSSFWTRNDFQWKGIYSALKNPQEYIELKLKRQSHYHVEACNIHIQCVTCFVLPPTYFWTFWCRW